MAEMGVGASQHTIEGGLPDLLKAPNGNQVYTHNPRPISLPTLEIGVHKGSLEPGYFFGDQLQAWSDI